MNYTGLSWYVSPEGSPHGDGSTEHPWDLASAVAHAPEVEPGDVIWIRGGVYRAQAPLECALVGAEDAPIQVWGDPQDGPAVIEFVDGRPHGLHIGGAYAWYGDFEVRCTALARWSDVPGSEGNPRGTGIQSDAGPGVRLIRLNVRDFGTSLFESQPHGLEILSCTFANSYWDAPDRSHGPGLYIRNPAGALRKRIENNVVFQHGRQGLQGFGSTPFAEVHVVGNIFFNNGVAEDGFHRNFMFGNGSDNHRNVVIEDNLSYFPAGQSLGHEYNMLGGDGGSHGLTLRGNWIAHEGRPALRINKSDGEVVENNRIVGGVEFTSFDGTVGVSGAGFEAKFPQNEYHREGTPPSGVWVHVRRDPSLPGDWRREGMAHVGVLNWEHASTVEVDLSELEATAGLAPGVAVRISPVENLGQTLERLYDGTPVAVPMMGWTPQRPTGRPADSPLPPTFPELGVFRITWPVQGEPLNRGPVRMPDPGAGLPAPTAWEVRRQAWRGADAATKPHLLAERRSAWRAQRLGRPL